MRGAVKCGECCGCTGMGDVVKAIRAGLPELQLYKAIPIARLHELSSIHALPVQPHAT